MIYYHVYDFYFFKVDRETIHISLSTERKTKMNKIQLSDEYKKYIYLIILMYLIYFLFIYTIWFRMCIGTMFQCTYIFLMYII